jgi:hypothetical protein
MPNWCSNVLEVSHPDRRKIVELRRAFRKGKMCDYIIPVPQDLMDTMAGSYGDEAQQAALEARTQANVEKYGYGNWYDFCVGNWGTKWDVGERGGDTKNDSNSVTLCFDSAWSPPMGVLERMVNEGFNVVAYYYEPGMAYVGKFDNGCDDCYDYGGLNSGNVRDVIGDELDDMFCISEEMANYEAENEEELTTWIREGAEKRNLEAV